MLGTQEKGTINLTCKEQILPNYPNLLFGTQIESGKTYFDASSYLQKEELNKTVQNFLAQYKTPILGLCEAYKIKFADVVCINHMGHYLIDSSFVYLFISFVEPNFLAYMCDKMNDVVTNGFTVSDDYLYHTVSSRFSKEVLETMIENGTTE